MVFSFQSSLLLTQLIPPDRFPDRFISFKPRLVTIARKAGKCIVSRETRGGSPRGDLRLRAEVATAVCTPRIGR